MLCSYSVAITIVSITFPLLACVSVALRTRSGKFNSTPLTADDFLILAALAIDFFSHRYELMSDCIAVDHNHGRGNLSDVCISCR